LQSNASSPLFSRFLRLFFRLLYHQFAWAYDLIAWIVSAGQWQYWVLSILSDLGGGRVLELGYGPGHLQVALCREGANPFGIDASAQMASIAFKRILNVGRVPMLIIGYAQFLPFDNNCFDFILASFPTNYILDPLTLSEAYRVLRPGGILRVLPLARPTGNSPISIALSWLFRLTGQAPSQASDQVGQELKSAYLDPCEQAGFSATASYRKVKSGELWLINAMKPSKL
jgi:ubiquinone/menaquinone biosynthesis C-methylase UbiE